VISGGKPQTLAGGEIDVINGLLSGATIASGSIVAINGTLALSGRIANSDLISAFGSPSFATLAISSAVVLSGGGKVSLSPSGNNQIVAAPAFFSMQTRSMPASSRQRRAAARSC